MAQILPTDAYDERRNGQKECFYCGAALSKGAIGHCERHEAIWREDIKIGLHKQNRLRELILKSRKESSSTLTI